MQLPPPKKIPTPLLPPHEYCPCMYVEKLQQGSSFFTEHGDTIIACATPTYLPYLMGHEDLLASLSGNHAH